MAVSRCEDQTTWRSNRWGLRRQRCCTTKKWTESANPRMECRLCRFFHSLKPNHKDTRSKLLEHKMPNLLMHVSLRWQFKRHHQNCSGVWEAEQEPERTEMTMLRRMMGKKRTKMFSTEEIRPRTGVANISEKIREARLKWLGKDDRQVRRSNDNIAYMYGSVWVLKDRKTKTEIEIGYAKNVRWREYAKDWITCRRKTWCADYLGKGPKKKTHT